MYDVINIIKPINENINAMYNENCVMAIENMCQYSMCLLIMWRNVMSMASQPANVQ
jgi:hypothetical protein